MSDNDKAEGDGFVIKDNRSFPELIPFFGRDVASIIAGFLAPPDLNYIRLGCDFVLYTYIAPICRYTYDFEAKVLDRSLMDFLDDEGFFMEGGALHGLIEFENDEESESEESENESEDENEDENEEMTFAD